MSNHFYASSSSSRSSSMFPQRRKRGAGRRKRGGGASRYCLERCLSHRRIPRVGRTQLKGADGATPPAGHSVDVNQLISDVSKQRRRSSSETVAAALCVCVCQGWEREKKCCAKCSRATSPQGCGPPGGAIATTKWTCCLVIFDQCEVDAMLTRDGDEIPLCATSQRD